jgi:PIN like domain
MRKNFPGYFQPNKDEINELWENCLFTVDANILLNLYRYSDHTRKEFIRILKSIEDRLWLPHQAAQEYFDNRLQVISQQEKAYEETSKAIEDLQGDLRNARQHPFISEKLMTQLTTVLGGVAKELTKNKKVHSARTSEDEIKDSIGNLFDGKVGQPYLEDQLAVICREGEERYAKKIPPGYKDDGKTDSSSSPQAQHRKFGDYIIWRQIIEKAAQEQKSIIFINDDKKEDWWLLFKGKTLGPRPELIKEFRDKSENRFHMYQADRFLKLAADHFKQVVKPEIFSEVRDLRMLDLQRNREMHLLHQEQERLQARTAEFNARRDQSLTRLAMLQAPCVRIVVAFLPKFCVNLGASERGKL